ncbi:MAG TPA: hypothetical protein VMP01_01840 [Pirellulaceae bacterium]|nr:hypothetical protein [Pirellulaceae bacterium]
MFHRRAIAAALVLAAALPLTAAEPVLTPQQGVLLLRNGNVIEGHVTRAGDYYLVTFGDSGEARLAAADVELFCVDLDDAYRYKRATMLGKGAAPHLDLAEWCLRHSLTHQAGEQLVAAMRKDATDSRVAAVERKLKLALAAPQKSPVRQPGTAATVSAEQLDKTIRALPPGSLEKFSAIVQPILLNRCAAGGCHGPTARSDFRLLRPAAGAGPSKRFTQQNLYAVLKYLDKENPDASPLLTLPQKRHGAALAAVFDKRTQHQLDDLVAWTRLVLTVPAPAPPATIGKAQTLLSQKHDPNVKPASAEVPIDAAESAASATAADGAPLPFSPPKDAAPLSPDGVFTPRDPFDPEIFNRKFRK